MLSLFTRRSALLSIAALCGLLIHGGSAAAQSYRGQFPKAPVPGPVVIRPVVQPGIVVRPGVVSPVVNLGLFPVHRYQVEYRLSWWQRIHTHHHGEAHQLENYLRSLGCQTYLAHNGGHYDVWYRCLGWQVRTFTSHYQAHQFEDLLERYGFHVHLIH
jgi:hypothetical protein